MSMSLAATCDADFLDTRNACHVTACSHGPLAAVQDVVPPRPCGKAPSVSVNVKRPAKGEGSIDECEHVAPQYWKDEPVCDLNELRHDILSELSRFEKLLGVPNRQLHSTSTKQASPDLIHEIKCTVEQAVRDELVVELQVLRNDILMELSKFENCFGSPLGHVSASIRGNQRRKAREDSSRLKLCAGKDSNNAEVESRISDDSKVAQQEGSGAQMFASGAASLGGAHDPLDGLMLPAATNQLNITPVTVATAGFNRSVSGAAQPSLSPSVSGNATSGLSNSISAAPPSALGNSISGSAPSYLSCSISAEPGLQWTSRPPRAFAEPVSTRAEPTSQSTPKRPLCAALGGRPHVQVAWEDAGSDAVTMGPSKSSDETPLSCCGRCCSPAHLVGAPFFDAVVAAVVLMNAVTLGLQSHYAAQHRTSDVPVHFRVCEVVFCCLFMLEFYLRLRAYGSNFFTMPGWEWNVFDMLVVAAQIMEEVLSSVQRDAPVDLSVIRTIRLLRFIKVIRISRVLRLIGELRTLVSSILSSMKPLVWVLVLLLMLIYMLSLMITQVVTSYMIDRMGDDERLDAGLKRFFGGVDVTCLTLFQSITSGISWDEAVRPLAGIHWALAPAWTLYICFSVFALLNVVTGIFVESALKSAQEDKEYFMINNLRELIKNFKLDTSGMSADGERQDSGITWDFFQRLLRSQQMREYFQAIDIDPSEARGLFDLLDSDQSGVIDADELLNGCLRLRGHAKALDLAILSKLVLRLSDKLLAQTLVSESGLKAHAERGGSLRLGSCPGHGLIRTVRLSGVAPVNPRDYSRDSTAEKDELLTNVLRGLSNDKVPDRPGEVVAVAAKTMLE